MTRANSTTTNHNRKARKPDKPYKDFPLTAHPCGLWCKKIRARVDGKSLPPRLFYFGSWRTDPKGKRALEHWLNEKDDLLAGRVPRTRVAEGVPVLRDLVNRFLTAKTLMLSGKDQAFAKTILRKKRGEPEADENSGSDAATSPRAKVSCRSTHGTATGGGVRT